MQVSMFRKPLFWILATLISSGLGYIAYRLFPIALPIVTLDLTMNRSCALSDARKLAQEQAIGPETFHQATTFESDNKAKIFIQLEGGGTEKFKQVIEEEYFAPYYWKVRHFNPQEKHEATFYFMPDGRPYGFKELIPDSTELPNLDKTQAEQLARDVASKNWSIDFAKHSLVEHSTEEKPNGRTDHTLVYERTDANICDAPYRVTIKVTGNKVTKVSVDLKIPEAFDRRYACMRSLNNIIAQWASTAMFLLYLLLGCLLGLILLVRSNKNWLLWRAPLICAAFIAIGMLLETFNSYPIWWMYYQTTDSTFSFIASIIQNSLITAGFYFVLLYISFLAAESLTRKAFPHHIQLWSLAQSDVASSWQVLGRTIGSYLILGFDFIFVTSFYLFSIKYLGWWSPADTLVEPNVLAHYVPWLSPVLNALRAGFWEECLFRAIPLSCVMLLAKRYGGKTYWWLSSGMVLQALIFAAAHANYPTQPAYARVIELIIPSFVFGGLYLAFGLLPAIISHVLYDLILMALPLFVSDAPGSFWNKGIVALCGLIPLFVVFWARIKKGRFQDLSERWYNGNWQAPASDVSARTEEIHVQPVQPNIYRNLLIIAGLLGLGSFILFRHTSQDVKPLSLTREQALIEAYAAQKLFGLNIAPEMIALSNTQGKANKNNMFVWRTAGKDVYTQLDGTFIGAPFWKVRFAQFDGDIAQTAEEYDFYLYPTEKPIEFEHTLPKEQEGASLTQDEARTMTHDFLKTYYHLNPEDVVEVSAQEEKQPHRRDWEFIYRLKSGPDIGEGQLRIRITIGGNQITAHDRHIHIPEQWERQYEYETKIEKLIKNGSVLLLVALILLFGLYIIGRRPVHPFAVRASLVILILVVLKTIVQTYNLWPIIISSFQTSVPYARQVYALLTSLLLQTIAISLFLAWLGGYVMGLLRGRCQTGRTQTLLQGVALGTIIAGISAFGSWITPATKPLWLDVTNAGAHMPWLSMGLKGFTMVLGSSLISLFIVHGANILTDYGRKQHVTLTGILLLLGIACAGIEPAGSLMTWLATGSATGLLILTLYYTALRFNYCLIPVLVATHASIDAIQEALLHVFPGAWAGALLTISISWLVAYWLINELKKNPI